MTSRPALALAAAVLAATAGCKDEAPIPSPPKATFVGSAACAKCHQDRHATWLRTVHACALSEADDTTVVAAFDGKPVVHARFTATPFRTPAGKYRLRVERRDGTPPVEYAVDRAIGRGMQQAFLTTGPKGDWQTLHITWNLREKRWQFTHEVLGEISDDPGRYDDFHPENHDFNHGCAPCHATGFDPGWDEATDVYRTRFVEGSVSCESCHGPGSAHVARQQRPLVPGDRYESPERLIQPRDDLDPEALHALCARCHDTHSWRYAIDDDPRVGPREISVPGNLDTWGFFADGRFSGLQYDSTVQEESLCRTRGRMTCLSCHDLHGGRKRAMRFERPDDDAQCTQCHTTFAAAPRAHTHHADLRCVDCHMPRLLGGLLAEQRDHSIRSPEPDLTARVGPARSQNACNACHRDRDVAWAQEWKTRWWKGTDPEEVARVILVARLRDAPDDVSTNELAAAAEDRRARTFHRLTALRTLMGRPGPIAQGAIVRLLADPNPDVRLVAASGAASRGDPSAIPALRPLLKDSIRVHRVEAAFGLARCGVRGEELRPAYAEAREMLVRRRAFDDVYERIGWIADALGEWNDAARALDSLERVTPWRNGPPHDRARELIHRRGRRLLEEGRLDEAARRLSMSSGEGGPPLLLRFDVAELLEAQGRRPEAEAAWGALRALALSDSLPGRLAGWRLALLRGGGRPEERVVREAVESARRDPAAAEWVRRAGAAGR